MNKLLCAAVVAMTAVVLQGKFLATDARAADMAATSCEDQAVGKDGKKLSGAAKTSFMKKCETENKAAACEDKAVDKNGKKLAGAAKTSFMKKCETEAKGGK